VYRTLTIALGLFALLLMGAPRDAAAQFICSIPAGGSRDGQSCDSDDDCPGGVCVLAQGVCEGGSDDSFACSCPGGTCSGSPVCTDDDSFGTCSGGSFAGECCDTDFNCAGGSCRSTQKVCVGGANQGLPCTKDAHCPSSNCRSTGKFCLGVCQTGASRGDLCSSSDDCDGAECFSDFQDAACSRDADCCAGTSCPSGICEGVAADTPTPTRTRTVTPTRSAATPGSTSTRTPTSNVTSPPGPTNTPSPTVAPSATEPPPIPTPTIKPPAGQSLVSRSTSEGSTTLTVIDATTFPAGGILEIVADPDDPSSVMRVGYSKSTVSNTLVLDAPLSRAVPAGAVVRSAPPPAIRYESIAEGGGCSVSTASLRGSIFWLSLAAAVAVLGWRRR